MTDEFRWLKDPSRRLCGLEARGLWMELLGIMAACSPPGHLSMNGQSPTPKQIASMVGMTNERSAAKLLDELLNAGLLSRTDGGVICSEMLVRDKALRAKRRAAGAVGGNPKLRRVVKLPAAPLLNHLLNLPAQQEVKQEVKQMVKQEVNQNPPGAAKIPDARDEVWASGLDTVIRLTGRPPNYCRKMLGKWLRAAKDDCAMVHAIINDCAQVRPGDPLAWIAAGITARMKPPDRFGWLDNPPLEPNSPQFDLEARRDVDGNYQV